MLPARQRTKEGEQSRATWASWSRKWPHTRGGAHTCTMGWGGWQGRTGWAALAWLSLLPAAQSQYLKTSKDELVVEKYYEVQKAGTKDLENLIGEHVGCPSALPTYLRTTTAACYPYLNEKYNPQDGVLLEAEFKPFADIDQYRCAGGALLHTARAQHPAPGRGRPTQLQKLLKKSPESLSMSRCSIGIQ